MAHALGISQNALARAIGSDSGHVSRVLRSVVTSAPPVQRRIEAFLARAERRARAQVSPPAGGAA